MNRNKKIDKINAYKRMLETNKLPTLRVWKEAQTQNPDDSTTWPVEEQIHDEFKTWAETQLAVLMGERSRFKEDLSGSIQFTDEEADVLRAFAVKVIAKSGVVPVALAPQTRTPQSAPQSNRPTPVAMGNKGTTSVRAEQIRNRTPGEPVGRVARLKNLSLEEMDEVANGIED